MLVSIETGENSLFIKYKSTKDLSVRNEIVLKYLHLVKYIAISLRNMYTGYIDTDDIIDEGVIGLMAAIDAFDVDRGLKFETYASIKVRGAIIDYIRKQDWVPRSVRKAAKDLDEAYNKLYVKLNRTPSNSEIAKYMGISEEKLMKHMADSSTALTLSFEELLYEDNFDLSAELNGDNVWATEKNLLDLEFKSMLVKAIDALPEREKLVISLYYQEKLRFTDISKVLNLTDSRVCQIHSKAILFLKNYLKKYIEM